MTKIWVTWGEGPVASASSAARVAGQICWKAPLKPACTGKGKMSPALVCSRVKDWQAGVRVSQPSGQQPEKYGASWNPHGSAATVCAGWAARQAGRAREGRKSSSAETTLAWLYSKFTLAHSQAVSVPLMATTSCFVAGLSMIAPSGSWPAGPSERFRVVTSCHPGGGVKGPEMWQPR